MLGVLCARPKPWILTSLSFFHASAHRHHHLSRLLPSRLQFADLSDNNRHRRHHSSACRLFSGLSGGAASIWHAILPVGSVRRSECLLRPVVQHERKGEGSWNVAWDARPARWLHRSDSAWLLFGVCACIAPIGLAESSPDPIVVDEKIDGSDLNNSNSYEISSEYRVTGVVADGRCLFRAIAHCACLRKGEEAPDENRERELADELRAQIVDELLKRRAETEWFIEGDFDAYVKTIQQPYVWGGEPELLMASHVLKTPISVFMRDRSSGGLVNISNYGEEYGKDKESPINVLFHGYGHYDILEGFSYQSCQKVNT